ncbi:MAG: hypothetical protein MUP85_01350 [Candidatus Lokiarchaeota archaeon]|nr:hypothetical protein [Candidatus Lokiarchaeota archaeon]
MNDLNIYDDSRNRGLEVLLHQIESDESPNQEMKRKCGVKFTIPILFNQEFHFKFETFIIKKPKFSGKE